MDNLPYRYFISYAHGAGFGCTILYTNNRIEDQIVTDLVALHKSIEDNTGVKNVVLLNFKEL